MTQSQALPTEPERKFLVTDKWTPSAQAKPMVQGYFTLDGSAVHLVESSGGVLLRVLGRRPDRRTMQLEVPVGHAEVERLRSYADRDGRIRIARGFEARARIKGSSIEEGVLGSGATATFTMKADIPGGGGREVRTEVEMALDVALAAQLLTGSGVLGSISKYRYKEPLLDIHGAPIGVAGPDGDDVPLMVEVDVYSGSLYRLVTAEVEFPSAESVDAQDWTTQCPILGTDITNDTRFANANLAVSGLPGFRLADGRKLSGAALPGLVLVPPTHRTNAPTGH